MKTRIFILFACSVVAFSQGTTSRLDGTVSDPQGAVIVGAEIAVVNASTGQTFKATTDSRGEWVIPSVPSATYRVTVTKPGFKSTTFEGVKMDAGVPATVNAKLEIGQLAEVVEVTAGGEIVQTENATVNTTLQGRQIFELPFNTRNALDLLVTQPGTQTASGSRATFVNGLPQSAINITVDGLNDQDNQQKSGAGGFFTYVAVPVDAIEEVTLTTAAAGADNLAQGAAQIKFITKAGTNEYHGGTFWQTRNTAFDANYYFNTLNGQPTDKIILNQGGGHVGGPIKKNKAFFFTNYEIFKLPSSSSFTRTELTPDAVNGIFTYQDPTTKQVRTVNLYNLAAGANTGLPASVRPYSTTADPIIANTLHQIAGLTSGGVVTQNIASNNDYNRQTLSYQPKGETSNKLTTVRLDYNLTDKHHIDFIYNYQEYNSVPDILNNVVPVYPGTGTVLGSNINAGQRSNRFSGVLQFRSSLSPRITNEFSAGLNGGSVLFRDQIASSALFSPWRGFVPTFGSPSYASGVTSVGNSSRRNAPVKDINDTISWIKGSHLFAFGGSFTQINLWQQSISTQILPTITFAVAAGDPINTGATGIFTNANFPNANPTQLADAANLYAVITGRVSTINRQVAEDENTKQYGAFPAIDRDRQREFGLFAQDTWKLRPNFTLTVGLRYEQQRPFVNISNTYTHVGLAGLYGVSGVGNLFAPGVLTGTTPQYLPINGVAPYNTPSSWDPSIGFAWVAPHRDGPLGWLTGKQGQTVLRAGYSIATVREGMNVFSAIWGGNQGEFVSANVSAAATPGVFGTAGSVLFRDSTLPAAPTPTTPSYPIAVQPNNQVLDFDPHLKMGYVQSWNFGLQREISKDTVMEVRYVGNHGVKLWRTAFLNETNIFENGFLNEFKVAENNLLINRQTSPNSNDFGNHGLPGQAPIPILQTALGTTTDTTTAIQLGQGQAGATATAIANNATRMGRLTAAGYPVNLFVVNPAVAFGGGNFLVNNGGSSYYDSMQVEIRRRLHSGLQVQGSWVWSHTIGEGANNSTVDQLNYTTLRNGRLDRVPTSFDIRQDFKVNAIYELPIGPGKRFLGGVQNGIGKRALEGWEIAGVGRLQSGTPIQIGSGRSTVNGNGSGVVLHNISTSELQSLMQIRKTSFVDPVTGQSRGLVYFLPQDLINNSLAAENSATNSPLDPTKPWIGPPTTPGQFGYEVFLYGPWQQHYDLSVIKKTKITERTNIELRAQMLDAFNLTNFQLPSTVNLNVNTFGQTTTAFRDLSGTSDPGSRVIEFVLRVNF